MDPKEPRTAKEAALLGAKADKTPFNREADRRHVIASSIRRVGEFIGQSEQATEAADAIQQMPLAHRGMSSAHMLSEMVPVNVHVAGAVCSARREDSRREASYALTVPGS